MQTNQLILAQKTCIMVRQWCAVGTSWLTRECRHAKVTSFCSAPVVTLRLPPLSTDLRRCMVSYLAIRLLSIPVKSTDTTKYSTDDLLFLFFSKLWASESSGRMWIIIELLQLHVGLTTLRFPFDKLCHPHNILVLFAPKQHCCTILKSYLSFSLSLDPRINLKLLPIINSLNDHSNKCLSLSTHCTLCTPGTQIHPAVYMGIFITHPSFLHPVLLGILSVNSAARSLEKSTLLEFPTDSGMTLAWYKRNAIFIVMFFLLPDQTLVPWHN